MSTIQNTAKCTFKKKVLIIGALPPPLHGAAVYFKQLCEIGDSNPRFSIECLNVNLGNTLGSYGKFSLKKTIRSLLHYYAFIKILLSTKTDIVYSQIAYPLWPFLKDSIFVILAKLFRRKIIGAVLGTGYSRNILGKGKLVLKYYSYILGKYDALFTPSLKMIKHDGFPSEIISKSIEVPFGIVPLIKYPTPIEENPSKFNILFMGNLLEEKGIYDCIKAIPYVVKKFCNINFIFAGKWKSKEDEERGMELIKSESVSEYCEFPGVITNEKKMEYLKNSHIFLLPTYYRSEGFPLALLDAMSFGHYLITCNHAGISSMIENMKNGVFCEPQNHIDLADKILYALKNNSKMSSVRRQAQADFFLKYTLESFVDRLFDAFENELKK